MLVTSRSHWTLTRSWTLRSLCKFMLMSVYWCQLLQVSSSRKYFIRRKLNFAWKSKTILFLSRFSTHQPLSSINIIIYNFDTMIVITFRVWLCSINSILISKNGIFFTIIGRHPSSDWYSSITTNNNVSARSYFSTHFRTRVIKDIKSTSWVINMVF